MRARPQPPGRGPPPLAGEIPHSYTLEAVKLFRAHPEERATEVGLARLRHLKRD